MNVVEKGCVFLQRSAKAALILFNIFIAGGILIAYQSNPNSYHVNFYELIPPVGWVFFTLAIGVGIYLISYKLHTGLYAATFVAVTLLLLPTIITGKPYGTDTYTKAGEALSILQGVGDPHLFYPGLTTHAAVVVEVADIQPVTVGPQIALALLSPLATVSFARALSLSDFSTRFLLTASMLGPLGFGVYLSTLSTFHPYYLSLPIAILFIALVTLSLRRGVSIRAAIIIYLVGFILLLFHPLSFVAATFFAITLYFAIGNRREPSQVLHLRQLGSVFRLFLPFAIYLGWFSFAGAGAFFLTNLSGVLRITTPSPTGRGQSNPPGGGISTSCLPPTNYVNHCGVLWPGRILTVLVIFGAAISIAWLVGFETIRSQGMDAFENLWFRAFLAVVLIAGGLMSLFGVGIIGRNILIRLLPFCAIASVTAIGIGWRRTADLSFSRIGVTILYTGGVLGVAGIILLRTVDSRIAAIAVISLASALAAGSLTQLPAPRRTQFGVVVVSILILISLGSIYPAPGVNTLPNQAASPGTEEKFTWIASYTTEHSQFASGQLEWRRHRYAAPGSTSPQFQGSRWIFSQIPLTEDQTLYRAGNNFAGERTDEPPDYITHRPYYNHYVKLTYIEDGQGYNTIESVTRGDIKSKYPHSGKVYNNGNGVVYRNR